MKRLFIFFTFLFLPLFLNGQSINRAEVKGVILSNTNDVESITVYNKSSNKGAITNFEGEFVIKVAKKDLLDIYTHNYIAETFNILPENIEMFIAFIETNSKIAALFKPEDEFQLIQFLFEQSELFIKLKDVKN